MLCDNNEVHIHQEDINIWTWCNWSASSALREGRKAATLCCIAGTVNQVKLGLVLY